MKKIIRTYLILGSLYACIHSLTATVYMLYMLDKGLDIFQANLCNMVFFITIFILEVPTGIFADTWKKKTSVQIGFAFWALGGIFFIYSNSMLVFIVAELLCAVGASFVSGAFTAWFVNESKYHGYDFDKNRHKIFSLFNKLKQIFSIVAGFIGGCIVVYDISYPWILSASLSAALTLLSMIIMTEHSHNSETVREGYMETFKNSFKICCTNSDIKFALGVVATTYCAFMSLNMLWQPFIRDDVNLDISILKYVWVAINLLIIFGAHVAPSLVSKVKSERMVLIISMLFIGIVIMLPSFFPPIVGLFLYLFHQVGRGTISNTEEAYIQHHFSDKYRATLGSMRSVVATLFGAIGLVLSGFVGDSFGVTNSWFISGVILISGALILKRFVTKS